MVGCVPFCACPLSGAPFARTRQQSVGSIGVGNFGEISSFAFANVLGEEAMLLVPRGTAVCLLLLFPLVSLRSGIIPVLCLFGLRVFDIVRVPCD